MEYEKNAILDHVRARLWRRNQNWISCIVGGVGSGKSWSALSIADYIDRKFSVDKVFFRISDFVKALNENKIEKGSCCVLDEMGIMWGARDFMRQSNKNMSYLFQVVRFLNFGVIMTVPSLYLIDKHGRNLVHTIFRTRGISYKEKYCRLEVKVVDFDPILGETYRKWPRIIKEGVPTKASVMKVFMPATPLRKAYEKKKEGFARELICSTTQKLEKPDKKPTKEPNVICPGCKYSWYYSGKLLRIKCSNCGHNFMRSSSKQEIVN